MTFFTITFASYHLEVNSSKHELIPTGQSAKLMRGKRGGGRGCVRLFLGGLIIVQSVVDLIDVRHVAIVGLIFLRRISVTIVVGVVMMVAIIVVADSQIGDRRSAYFRDVDDAVDQRQNIRQLVRRFVMDRRQ